MLIALVGATASGKTEIAIEMAQRFGAEIVGADSRQVYRRLDIGSAKPTAAQRSAVPHHLIDVVEPDQHFDCARYRELALAAIDDIHRRGRRVLVVGGTGLYVSVLARGLFAGPPRDAALRARLIAEENEAAGSLHRRLAAVDPVAAARLHARDQVRLVRALEVFEITGRPISEWQAEHARRGGQLAVHVIALDLPRDELYARIDARCREMVHAGLIEEVRALLDSGLDPELPSLRSPGYAEIGAHVRGLCSLGEALTQMSQATRRLAKRQLTWMRGHPPAAYIVPTSDAVAAEIAKLWGGG